MDPVAHTLVGAMLAESGLKRRSRHATATLLIGANLPDVDAVAGFWGSDVELYVRRGWTHGVLALVVLPLLLAGGVALWHRWRGARSGNSAPFHAGAILALSFLAVWSHPLLDWLNTYGVRLLMPFDGRWFYGDTLFIVDPWLWLMVAAGVVLAHSATKRAVAGWMLLAVLASALVLSTDMVPLSVKIVWCAGVALLVALRWLQPAWSANGVVARIGIAALLVYIATAWSLGRLAESLTQARFANAEQVQANPMPGLPFVHRMVVVESDRYHVIDTEGVDHGIPRQQADAIVSRALASDSIRGFANWARFPYWTVEERRDGWRVQFKDLRYQGPDVVNARGIGVAEVIVPKDPAALAANQAAR